MSSATQIRTLDQIEEAYVSPGFGEVREFLNDRPEIATLLINAESVIPRHFGEGTTTTLLVQDDPDGQAPQYIAAYIRTALEPAAAFELLHQVIDALWPRASNELREDVLFSLDLV